MSQEISPQLQNQIAQLQQLQQQAQALTMQKSQIEMMLKEMDGALEELVKAGDDDVIYRNVGEILIKSDKASVQADLTEKKETFDLRLKTIERQDERVQKRFQQLQEQVKQAIGDVQGAPGAAI
ncbi:MAG: Prefoldin subunit beta [Candidatus Syntrophoarchaeum sp. GoM_oil]|nr:MAG: Prefoldin subunit beta [Candidatus Syntrophoarchaeum sp. GoM_oil]